MASKIRVALAQMAPKMGDVERNFSKVFKFLSLAKEQKADLIIYPELATAGYLSQGIFLDVPEKEQILLNRLVEETKDIHAVLGMVEEDRLGILHNAALVVGGGRIVEGNAGGVKQTAYRKCYLPTYGMFEEHRWFAPGCRVPVFNLNIKDVGPVTLGVVICEDYWHPLPVRIAAMRGSQLTAVISASPKTLDKPQVVDALLVTRAVENATYLAFVNAAGSEDMVNFWGGSRIVSPEGRTLVQAKTGEEDFVVGEVDLYRGRKLTQRSPMLREERLEMVQDYLKAFEESRRD